MLLIDRMISPAEIREIKLIHGSAACPNIDNGVLSFSYLLKCFLILYGDAISLKSNVLFYYNLVAALLAQQTKVGT